MIHQCYLNSSSASKPELTLINAFVFHSMKGEKKKVVTLTDSTNCRMLAIKRRFSSSLIHCCHFIDEDFETHDIAI